MILKMVITQCALVHGVELHGVSSLGPPEVNQRQIIILHPDFSSLEDSAN